MLYLYTHIAEIQPHSFVSTVGGQAAFYCLVSDEPQWRINGFQLEGLNLTNITPGFSNISGAALTFKNLSKEDNGTLITCRAIRFSISLPAMLYVEGNREIYFLPYMHDCKSTLKPRLHVNFNSLPVVYPSTDPALEVGWNFNPDSLFQSGFTFLIQMCQTGSELKSSCKRGYRAHIVHK